MIRKISVTTYQNQLWKYYKNIEDELVLMERYVAFDKRNEGVFSTKFNDVLQSACNEFETVAKNALACSGMKKTDDWSFNRYCYYLVHENLIDRNVTIVFHGDWLLNPLSGARFVETEDDKGKKYTYEDPHKFIVWWSAHNKTKHKRTSLVEDTKEINYTKANLLNVINSVAALYYLELCFVRLFVEKAELGLFTSELFCIALE